MNLTNEQKVIIHDAIDQMHDRLLKTRVGFMLRDIKELPDLDEYIEEVGSLLALDWGPS